MLLRNEIACWRAVPCLYWLQVDLNDPDEYFAATQSMGHTMMFADIHKVRKMYCAAFRQLRGLVVVGLPAFSLCPAATMAQEHDIKELGYRWREQLFLGGIEVTFYDVDEHTLLVTLQRGCVRSKAAL